jgi:hypothetical protein
VTPLRVGLAGLAAGAVNLVAGFAFAHLVGVGRFQALLRQHGLRAIGEHPADAIAHTAVRLLLGLGVTTLYACLVARFGPGPRAALAAAGFAWAFVYAYTAWGHAHIGLFPRSWVVRDGPGVLVRLTHPSARRAGDLVSGWQRVGPGGEAASGVRSPRWRSLPSDGCSPSRISTPCPTTGSRTSCRPAC